MNMFACKHTSQRGPASVSGPHTAAHRGRFDSDQRVSSVKHVEALSCE